MFQKIMNKLNDLRPKQLMMLAIGAAILMFMTIYAGMSFLEQEEVTKKIEEVEKQPVIETTKVVVAKTNIPPRTIIQETMVQMKELPVDAVPEGAIQNFNDVLNVKVQVSIFAGDVLTVQKILADKRAEGFIGTIPDDCRAVSISVNDITGVSGFAKPGDKVDLLLVEKGDYSATTEIILQNIPLLSVNQDMGNSMLDGTAAKSGAISNPTLATFALHPDEVLKLISASKLGEIYMSLRPEHPQNNYVDETNYTMESVNAPQPKQEPVSNSTPVIPENTQVMPLPQLPAAPSVPKIEIIQGDEITQKADEAPVIVTPTSPASPSPTGINPPLPVIPSGSANIPRANSPLADVPFANSNVIRPPSNN